MSPLYIIYAHLLSLCLVPLMGFIWLLALPIGKCRAVALAWTNILKAIWY